MMQSIITLIVGVVVLLCVALLAAARAKGEHNGKRIREPVARWLDTHPVRDWVRHRH